MKDRRRVKDQAPQGAGILVWTVVGLAFWAVVIYLVIY